MQREKTSLILDENTKVTVRFVIFIVTIILSISVGWYTLKQEFALANSNSSSMQMQITELRTEMKNLKESRQEEAVQRAIIQQQLSSISHQQQALQDTMQGLTEALIDNGIRPRRNIKGQP